jgi:hypothetical protein
MEQAFIGSPALQILCRAFLESAAYGMREMGCEAPGWRRAA